MWIARISALVLSVELLFAAGLPANEKNQTQSIAAIVKAADGAIVTIVMSDKDGHAVAQGSGFVLSRDGIIVTNYHVIETGSSAVVKLPDGAFFVVDGVLASDKVRDLAVVKAHGKNFRTLALGDSDRLQVGEEVVAIGNPLSLESTVSNGIVSGIRTVEGDGGKLLQVTTPISPGSSGGPLFNMAGDVVGITTLYLKGGQNLNFAIPINDAKRLLLTKSTTIQALPNAKTRDEDASAVSVAARTNPTDRDYYQQLFDAGGFAEPLHITNSDGSPVTDGPKTMLRTADYVCFADNTRSGSFFTFTAYGFDENYNKAQDELIEVSDEKERGKRLDVMRVIQQGAPYIDFVPTIAMNAAPLNFQKFFRSGGRTLTETVYQKGVKVGGTLEYHWNGSAWLIPVPPADPNAYTLESKTYSLSIEPTTMRYVEATSITLTVGKGDTAATGTHNYGPWGGVCEKIPQPK
jgi:hypothetical protein